MDHFFLTLHNLDKTGGYYYESKSDIFYNRVNEAEKLSRFLNHHANKKGLGLVEVKKDGYKVQVVSSELSFILVFLNFFESCGQRVRDVNRDKYFVLGNSRYAFSNNEALTCFVPDLKRAFLSEGTAVSEMRWNASSSPILKMEHCTLDRFNKLIEEGEIHPSRIWSPLDEDKFFETTDFETNQSRKEIFEELLTTRVESKKGYVYELINSINDAIHSGNTTSIICSGVDDMAVMVDPTRIAAIVPDSDPWDMISAKIVIPNETVITVPDKF